MRLDTEMREIKAGLRRARRDEFNLEQELAARPIDIRRAMLDYQPSIVHFCGHGGGESGIVLENDAGNAQLVSDDALAGLFELFADSVECVVLNACFSERQAKAIARHIDYVMGMEKEITDRAALEFSVALYDALAAGKSYGFAFRFGCNAIQMAGIKEYQIPQLITGEARERVPEAGEEETFLREDFERELDDFDSFYSTSKRTGVWVNIYWHEQGLTERHAQEIKRQLEDEGISTAIDYHRDPSPPDAAFIGALVSAQEARLVLSKVPYRIRYLFPVDYPRFLGGDPNGLLIGIGYMSTHDPGSAARETTPVRVSSADLDALLEPGLSNTEFQNRLRALTAPAAGDRSGFDRWKR